MKVAVTYENGQIFQHFGHSKQFKVYEIEDGTITSSQVLDAGGSGHGALAGFLKDAGAEALICGGIGGGARTALEEAKIKLYGGVSGDADSQVQSFAEGNLKFNPDVQCSHHGSGHEHTEGGCGGHDGHHCTGHSK